MFWQKQSRSVSPLHMCLCTKICPYMYTQCIVQRPYGLVFSGGNSQVSVSPLRRLSVDTRFQRRVAVCCSVLQCFAVCCSALQCVAVCCMKSFLTVCVFFDDPSWTQDFRGVLQCVAGCCSVLQCVAVCCRVLQGVAVYCAVVQCVAVCCRVSLCIALWCSVL